MVDRSGRVLDQAVTYETMYARLREYLVTLGAYEGETPHSFRAGCSIHLGMSGSVQSEAQLMDHVGWHTQESAVYYTRVEKLRDAPIVAGNLASSTAKTSEIEETFFKNDESGLTKAFL